MDQKFSLAQLNGEIKKVISGRFNAPLWVVGEIAEMNVNQSGHCYLTLIEKEEDTDKIVAQARATIWSYTFRMLRPFFETTTGQPFRDGIKVLLQVSVEFHELYGYSLNVRNIDPTYTLGDLARRRLEIIQRLKAEGVYEMNKELELPLVPQRIAIISSPTAAGYQDFMQQLGQNAKGYHFYTCLFPALMQGNQAEQSIRESLDKIYAFEEHFDVVVMIRGGGSQVDLSCFDNYQLAYHVTQFPLPILTGIGHDKDESIVDMVAHSRLKTPTAVAEFIVAGVTAFEEKLDAFESQAVGLIEEILEEKRDHLEELSERMATSVRGKLETQRRHLVRLSWQSRENVLLSLQQKNHALEKKIQRIHLLSVGSVMRSRQNIDNKVFGLRRSLEQRIALDSKNLEDRLMKTRTLVNRIFLMEKQQIEFAARQGELSDPANILKKGYSITTSEGKLVKNPEDLHQGTLLKTTFLKGELLSRIVENTKK
ncbi:MAG: exodeoxyribonuclease VII large subunit [Marinilabiliales bacterium]|nr:exodeoxyribonuclease VII large subunit [Marinilabiliales bacterium]